MRKRNLMFQKAKRSNQASDHTKYRQMRNKITALIRSAKRQYFAMLNVSDTRQVWKAYKAIHKQFNSVPNLVHDGIEGNTDIEKADLLNQFFSTCWNTEVPPLIYGTDDHSISCPDELLCSEEEVLHFLMQLDTTRATGPDNIPAQMLKETARAIIPSLTKLFNISMQQCSFPTSWKSANIVPIPKASSLQSTPIGYRPISLLPIVSEVFEKHIYSLVSSHLHEHCPISDKQWGFHAGKSTTTALITTVHRWLSYLDCGNDIAVIFFDFKKPLI